VAGYLRACGLKSVEVIPPTPYPAGPLRLAFVRVLHEQSEAKRLVSDAEPEAPTPLGYTLRMRLLAEFVLLLLLAGVA
jgi:hypothetical protein